jgi:hypothetical protein
MKMERHVQQGKRERLRTSYRLSTVGRLLENSELQPLSREDAEPGKSKQEEGKIEVSKPALQSNHMLTICFLIYSYIVRDCW